DRALTDPGRSLLGSVRIQFQGLINIPNQPASLWCDFVVP
ncbi:7735_t:CDS:1, partial [Gigaspora margarita]